MEPSWPLVREARGAYNLAVTVDADAFNGALCSHNDDGEEVATVFDLLVLDFTILNEDGEEAATMAVGDGSLPLFLFASMDFPVVGLIAYVSASSETASTSTLISASRMVRSLKASPPRTVKRWLTATELVLSPSQLFMSLKVSLGFHHRHHGDVPCC